MNRLKQVLLASAVLGALAVPAHAAQRAYVASFGSDANTGAGCTLALPCRGFTAAHSVVDAGGEIVALDAAGYGALTITKSVTVTANQGFFAGIAASSGAAITVATAGVNVTLRGLNINGLGATRGVAMSAGDSLTIENCVISNFTIDGVRVDNVAKVRILNSLMRTNGQSGVRAGPGTSTEITGSQFLDQPAGVGVYANNGNHLSVRNSVMSGNAYGVGADGAVVVSVIHSTMSNNGASGLETHDTSSIYVGYSQITHNGVGMNAAGTGTMGSMGNNVLTLNAPNTAGTITPVGGI